MTKEQERYEELGLRVVAAMVLTAEEKHVAAQLGLDPEDLLRTKRDLALKAYLAAKANQS